MWKVNNITEITVLISLLFFLLSLSFYTDMIFCAELHARMRYAFAIIMRTCIHLCTFIDIRIHVSFFFFSFFFCINFRLPNL